MWKRILGFWGFGRAPAKGLSITANNDIDIKGDNNNIVNSIVNITLQGGATLPLTLQKTCWNDHPQGGVGVAALLEWRTRLAPLIGREKELTGLAAWLQNDVPLSFVLLHADGGYGKTRLAAEFADLHPKWQHGWISLQDFQQVDTMTWQGKCLLLVDYAEHQPDPLARLARAAQRAQVGGNGQLRVLLVVRERPPVEQILKNNQCAGYIAVPTQLRELTAEQDFEVFQAVLTRRADMLGHGSKAANGVTATAFHAWRAQNALHRNPLFVTALAIDLAEPAAADNSAHPWLAGADLLQCLVNRECSRWALAEKGHQAPPGAIETVLVWSTLANGLTGEQINDVLAPAYLWTSAQLHAIHKARAAVWPSHNYQILPLAPDLLAAQFLAHWRSSDVAQGRIDRDARLAESLFQIESRANFQPRFERLHMLAYDQAVRIGACTLASEQALQHWLLSLVQQSPNLGKAYRMASTGRSWTAFGNLVISLGTHALGQPDVVFSEAERARQHNNQTGHLLANGNSDIALGPAQEAVSIHRRLALANPVAYEPDLAMSLNNLAICMGGMGNQKSALALLQEAVSIRRRLVLANSAAHGPGLATSLINLASCMSSVGDRTGALAPAQEALRIYRRLSRANLAVYEPGLATCLNNVANIMSDVGDRQGALAPAQEAVSIRRRLALANPAVHEPDLALSLSNLANRTSNVDDRQGALALAQESVSIRRRLARANPAAHVPGLAGGLNNLSNFMSYVGDLQSALTHAQEAVSIHSQLALTNPMAYEPDLAKSLNNLANCTSGVGDRQGALALAQESVSIRGRLALANPAAYEPDLAMSFGTCMQCFRAAGDVTKARASGEEALVLFTRLCLANPAKFEHFKESVLNELAELAKE